MLTGSARRVDRVGGDAYCPADEPRTAAALGAACLVVCSGTRAGHTFNHARQLVHSALMELAPLAEEYFFRGLLYRALDREWGGWRLPNALPTWPICRPLRQ